MRKCDNKNNFYYLLKSISLIFFVLLIAGCAGPSGRVLGPAFDKVGKPFEIYPKIPDGKGQLIIYEIEDRDSKLVLTALIFCNGKPCGRMQNGRNKGRGGSYTVIDLDPGDVIVKTFGDETSKVGPKIVMKSNELRAKIAAGQRVVVFAKLTGGSETHWGTTLMSAEHSYIFKIVPEEIALPLLRGLTQVAL